jgi:phage tail-like protein
VADDFETSATVQPTNADRALISRAWATPAGSDAWASAEIALEVLAKGRWLRYLPSIYEEDELMGRLVMLFESFWSPIEQQIDEVPAYFDSGLAPPQFLPWLASWLNLTLDENWPEAKRRRLLRSAASLFRRRGTKAALLEYLEIYTGVHAQITEYRAVDLRLGPDARLGPRVALGRGNVPGVFTVQLRLPAIDAVDPRERARLEAERLHVIESIIEAEKPAHTSYRLQIV